MTHICIRPLTGPSLFQIVGWRLLGAKPIFEPLVGCQRQPRSWCANWLHPINNYVAILPVFNSVADSLTHWGQMTYTNLEKVVLVQKRLIRLITGSPYRAHTEPLFVTNIILTFKEINEFTIGVFMFKSQNGDLPEIFDNYYQTHGDIHGRETRNADALYVPYGRLDIRRTSISIYGADVWNSIPTHIQRSESVEIFKHRLQCHLIDRKLHVLI